MRFLLLFRPLLLAVFLLLASCEGDRGPVGPQGPPGPGRQGTFKVLVAAADLEDNMLESLKRAYEIGIFPLGTVLDLMDLRTKVPTVDELLQYDAVLCYTLSVPRDPIATGNVLADYVDRGGGVVIGQGAYSPAPFGGLAGRIMTEGYSPLLPAPRSLIIHNRLIDSKSLEFPYHPIFNKTDVDSIRFLGQPNFSNPGFDSTAVLLAKDTQGFNALAINVHGNVIGTNIPPRFDFGEGLIDNFCDAYQLVANALVFVAGGF